MAEIAEHLDRGGFDIQFRRRHAEGRHQRPGIAFGVIGRREAGHGKREDGRARQAELVEGLGADDQRLCGVQAAGDADDHFLQAGCLHPLHQAGNLDVVGLVTILLQPSGIGGDEGEAFERAEEADICIRRVQLEADGAEGAGVAAAVGIEGAHLQPLLRQQIEVDVGDGGLVLGRETRGFGQGGAVLEHRCLAVPGEIGGRFARSGGGVEIGCEAAGGLRPAQEFAGFRFADGDVGGRQVRQHGGSGEGRVAAGGGRDPDVLADFRVYDQAGEVLGLEQEVGAEGDAAAGNQNVAAGLAVAADEVAGLIELPIVGQVDFRHDAEQAAAVDGERAVVEGALVAQRGADQQQRHQLGRGFQDRGDSGFDSIEQGFLLEQVADGIAGYAKFGEHRQRDGAAVAVLGHAEDRARVGRGIGEGRARGTGRDAGEAVAVEGPEAHGTQYRAGWGIALPRRRTRASVRAGKYFRLIDTSETHRSD